MADTTVSEIIVQAFREGNFTAVGETTTSEELSESIPRLRNLISSLLGFELGEAYRDWYVPTSLVPEAPLQYPLTPDGSDVTSAVPYQYPPQNTRLVVKITEAKTLYFPAMPNDGARMAYVDMGSTVTADMTLNGNGRLIEGSSTIVSNLDGVPSVTFHGRKWMYRADLGNWILLEHLDEATDTVPLPPEFDDLLVCGLAMRLAPRFQVQVDEVISSRYTDMLMRLKKRYKQSERMPTSHELRQLFREI